FNWLELFSFIGIIRNSLQSKNKSRLRVKNRNDSKICSSSQSLTL
ncbi:unnamed protein product, partial [Larinioides sclopetarius]